MSDCIVHCFSRMRSAQIFFRTAKPSFFGAPSEGVLSMFFWPPQRSSSSISEGMHELEAAEEALPEPKA